MSKTFTAVIIDYNYIKIIEAVKKNRVYVINNFSLDKLNQNSINNNINNYANSENIGQNLIAEEIKKIFGLKQFSKKNVFTVLNDDYINTYNFSLPEIPEPDLSKAIEYEIKKKSPFPISQIVYDYIYIYQPNEDGRYNLLISAYTAKKEYSEQLVNLFTGAEIKLKSIESKTIGLYNANLFIYGNKAGLHYLIIDVNLISIKIIIIYKNTIIFERNIEEINIIQNTKNINEAGEIISAEIQKTVDFYYAGKSIEPIEKIYLSGVYSSSGMFKNIISNLTNMSVETMSIIELLNNSADDNDKKTDKNNNNDKTKPLIRLSSKLNKKIYKKKLPAKNIYNTGDVIDIETDNQILSNSIPYDENNLFDILDVMLPAFGLILGK
ncbi:MAG: pilus assembly protein PilM [bacterium]